MDAGGEFARGHHQIGPPIVAIAHVHELDEAHDHGRAAEAFDQIERGVIVQAAFDDGVDLDRRQAGGDGGLDAAQDLIERAEAAAHAREDFSVQGVQADGHAAQAVGLQIDGMLPQQHPVGGERDVVDARNIGQIADQIREIRAQQRFAAGEAQLAHP